MYSFEKQNLFQTAIRVRVDGLGTMISVSEN